MHSLTVFGVLSFPALWHLVVEALPDVSNFILVLVGVVMSLPKLAERIEDNKKARYGVAIGCIVFGIIGIAISAHQREQESFDIRTLIDNTNTLVKNTNTMIATFGVLMPQIATLKAEVVGFDAKIEAARGNPQLIAALMEQKKTAEAKEDAAHRKLLLSWVPTIFTQLRDLGQHWYDEDDRALTLSPPSERDARRSDVAARFLEQAKAPVETANTVRQQLLQELPPSLQTPEDQRQAELFRRIIAGQNYPRESIALRDSALYLLDLANRVQSAPLLTN
jgi:hypothetical protein